MTGAAPDHERAALLRDLAAARWREREARSAGHAAGCWTVWDGRPCSCPGRRACVGPLEAARLDAAEREASSAVWSVLRALAAQREAR